MSVSIRKFLEGLGFKPKAATTIDTKGELEVLDSDGRLYFHDGTSVNKVVSATSTDTLTNKTIDADGTGNSISNIENADIKAAAAIDASKIADGSVSSVEFQYLGGVTSDIQTQLNTGATGLSDHINDTTDAHDASAISNVPSGNLAATDVQAALNELQSDIDGKQPLDAELTAIAGLTSAADKGIQFTGVGTAGTFDLTTAGKAILDDADATAQRVTLGVVIGTDVQAFDAELAAIAGLTSAADKLPYFTGSGTAAVTDFSSTARTVLDDTSTSAMRTTLGVAIGTDVQAFDAQLSSLIRQNSQSAAYTTVLTDGGKHIFHPSADTTARTYTIDSNANVAYPIGTAITFVNQNSAGVITIAITSDTMRLAGAGTTGSRTLAANGIATALKITSTEWIINGTGLT